MTSRRLTSALCLIAALSLSCGANPFASLALESAPPSDALGLDPEVREVARVLDRLHTSLVPEEERRTAIAVVDEARRTGLAPELVLALIQVESSGNAFAVSHVGAMGLMQLRPRTAEEVAAKLGVRWTGPAMLFDPVTNVRLGTEYLRQLVERYQDIPTALAAYNWGPTRIGRKMRAGEAIPAAYADKVLSKYSAAI